MNIKWHDLIISGNWLLQDIPAQPAFFYTYLIEVNKRYMAQIDQAPSIEAKSRKCELTYDQKHNLDQQIGIIIKEWLRHT